MVDRSSLGQRAALHLSRRKLLGAVGGLGLFTALAGCQSTAQASSPTSSATTNATGTTNAAPTAQAAAATAAPTSAPTTAPAATPKASAAPAASPAVQLTYATDWTTGARGDTLKAALDQFQKESPQYTVKIEPIGGDYFNKLSIEISGGTAADIMLFSGSIFLNFQQKGAFADIDPYVKALNVSLDDYSIVPHVFQAEGKQYGMPFQMTVTTWYANVDLFQKAGVPLPQDGWDWNEMLAAAQKLTNASQKQWGVWMQNSDESFWGPLVLSAGGNWLSKDQTKVAFGDGDGFEGFKFAVELVTKYKVSPTPAQSKGMTSPETSDLFVQEHVAMTPANSSAVGTYEGLVKDRFHWQPIPQPVYPKTHQMRTTYNDQPNVINKNAKDVEGAVKFAVFMAGEFVQGQVTQFRGSTPVLKKLQTSEQYLRTPPPNMQQIITNLGKAEDLDFVAKSAQWRQAFRQEADRAFIGETTPEDAFKNAVDAANKVLAQG